MQEVQEESIKEPKKEVQKSLRFISDAFAVEVNEKLPPLDALKFVKEDGALTDVRPETIEDKTRWFRKQERLVSAIMAFCGIGLLLILLSATNKYATGAWDAVASLISFAIHFIIGLLPSGWFSWLPI